METARFMKKETKEVLTAMGFTCLTGSLWINKVYNIHLTISDEDYPLDIVRAIFESGARSKCDDIKKILDIK